ncbi:MAG: UDP-N-acetylglucosamine 2-epimerase (hydrolyzing) [Clostridia bacterium]|nr:UDP-N-acetylglucosamine 2-epimerase (hydrolyzing) [Clostridia bacterium]
MYNVAFATGSRADYGIVRGYLQRLKNDENVNLCVLVTGALLDKRFGKQVSLIEQDGFEIGARIPIPINNADNTGVLHSMSVAQDGFAEHFGKVKYDLLIILGDRYEMLPIAIAAAMHRVPMLHLHGGEATFGNYDEFIRHSITKMSTYHFTATDEYRKRVIQLGENPENVFYTGALGSENCKSINLENVPQSVLSMDEKGYFVVLFHPETLTNVSTLSQINELLCAIEGFSDYKFVFIGANADTQSDIIRSRVHQFVAENENVIYYENLHPDAYHELVRRSICLVGNSSSGIIEAPSLGVYTVNIGDRQKGRVRGNSVIDVRCEKAEIQSAIERVLSLYKTVKPQNPYYKENCADTCYALTMELLKKDTSEPKAFYDIEGL